MPETPLDAGSIVPPPPRPRAGLRSWRRPPGVPPTVSKPSFPAHCASIFSMMEAETVGEDCGLPARADGCQHWKRVWRGGPSLLCLRKRQLVTQAPAACGREGMLGLLRS